MTDARARLWLGISTVGMWASLAVLMLVMRVPQKLLPTSPIAFLEELRWIALLLSGFVLIGFPFDLLGGYILPRRYNRSLTSMRRYIANWLQGVVIHGVVLTLTAIALLQFGRWGGSLGILTTVACGMLLLLFFQSALARWVGRLQSHGPLQPSNEQLAELKKYGVDPSRTQVFAGCDEGFTSGIVGLPRMERIMLPAAWLRQLKPAQIAIILQRVAHRADVALLILGMPRPVITCGALQRRST